MLLEDQRHLHEELERLEDAIADRLLEDPPHIRERLARDHDIADHLRQIEDRSHRLLTIYKDVDRKREDEVRAIALGDPMESFAKKIKEIKEYHQKYPNMPVENLERAYKRRTPEDQTESVAAIEALFTGEEGFGRFFDLTTLHDQYSNLPAHHQSRRLTYLQYLDVFDVFVPPQSTIRREQKFTEAYFQYLKALQAYLESFMQRTKPLENLDKIFAHFDKDFEEQWAKGEVPGWGKAQGSNGAPDVDTPTDGIYCSACNKSFAKDSVYEAHLKGKKHKKAVQERSANESGGIINDTVNTQLSHLKERAVAEREFRIRKLAAAMQTERSDTKVNVERKQGMTERERQQELEQLYSEIPETVNGKDDDESDGEDKISNPLKLPLGWDGKPIPFWLYKLHGLGQEFSCEICGSYTYMGRREFDKHFSGPRHIHGLRCLGISNTSLFREITSIAEAQALWKKIQQDKKKEKLTMENVIQMEDAEGRVMPEKVYKDLVAQGLI